MRAASTYRAAKRKERPQRRRVEDQGNLAEIAGRPVTIPSEVMDAAKSLTVADIDRALERVLSKHWQDGNSKPMLLNGKFAIRARAMNWLEGVEFEEGMGEA